MSLQDASFVRRTARATAAMSLALAIAAPLLLRPGVARADADAPASAPRATAEAGAFAVVLIANDGKLLGFVDRVEDNAVVDDATLSVTPGKDAAPIDMRHSGAGLLVAAWPERATETPLHVRVASAALGAAAELDMALPATAAAPAAQVAPAPLHPASPWLWIACAGLTLAALLLGSTVWRSRLAIPRARKLPHSAPPQT